MAIKRARPDPSPADGKTTSQREGNSAPSRSSRRLRKNSDEGALPVTQGRHSSESSESSSLYQRESVLAEKPLSSANKDRQSLKIKESTPESDSVLLDGAVPPEGAQISPNKDDQSSEIDSLTPQADSRFISEAFSDKIAMERWPHRYQKKNKLTSPSQRLNLNNDVDEVILQARCHYKQAKVDGRVIFSLGDSAYVKAGEGEDNHICRIIEFFEAVDGKKYFTAQWFYRARDTVIKNHADLIDSRRVFLSDMKDDNPLDCLVDKLKIVKVGLSEKVAAHLDCDYYYNMMYLLSYSTFIKLPKDDVNPSSLSSDVATVETHGILKPHRPEITLLDLYSGCGGMSTGLCLGANMSGLNLVTRWAVDVNSHACESIRLNHPETQVRNEPAEDVLKLSKEWEKLCAACSLIKSTDSLNPYVELLRKDASSDDEESEDDEPEQDSEIFVVEKILDICYGDPKENNEPGLYVKVSWKGYGPSEDSWEPIGNLGNCQDSIKEFVTKGYESKIIPLPGDVDVICGGPPCQGVSGFNRFRNTANPLEDEKNKQLVVFMSFVEYLRPKYVLMENVVDILKFSEGYLGRYALGQLIRMNYQARLGIMAAGAYGLPQFRLRVFLWGALPTESLPSYPLPTYDVVLRGMVPREFQDSIVAHDEGHSVELNSKLLLGDAISDLPPVTNDEDRDEMPYRKAPRTSFQQLIRLKKDAAFGSSELCDVLYDHRPLKLNDDDILRVCRIPKKKGANFRDLPGVLVGDGNRVKWDPDVERELLPSGKPLVPDYAMSFVDGRSSKPFGRLWWDETVATVVTRAEPHNQVILHPEQDRVLSIRENARLQGFPDYYKLCGPIKERYIQVGNAVAVPVARALGYALGISRQGSIDNGPLLALPLKFPNI